MNPLLELADRVEAGHTDVREVECRVWLATTSGISFDAARQVVPDLTQWQAPPYLRSLDAAVALVPRGWAWLRKDFSTMTCVQLTGADKGWAQHLDGMGATPAAALTAASLRAIASMGSSG